MIAWKSLQLLSLCAILAAWSNAQAQEAKPNGGQLEPVYSAANPKGGWKVKTQETRGAYSVLESVVQPSTGPEPHRHSREDEGFYILEGQYEWGLRLSRQGRVTSYSRRVMFRTPTRTSALRRRGI